MLQSHVDREDDGSEVDDVNAIEIWESEDSDNDDTAGELNNSVQVSPANIALINFVCMFLLTWQTLFRIPNLAMGLIYKFMSIFLSELGSQSLMQVYEFFPDTLKKAQIMQSINYNKNFEKLIVCPKCYSTYEQADCINGKDIARCSYIRFPRHPHANMRTKCNEKLVKTVKTALGKRILVPLKIFCYKSIIKNLVQQPGMLDNRNYVLFPKG